jgi:hypothetical protein
MFLLKYKYPGDKYWTLVCLLHRDNLQDLVDDKTFTVLEDLTSNEIVGVEFNITLKED